MIASVTLLQLRRYARRRAETEEELAGGLCLPPGDVATRWSPALRAIDLDGTHHLRQCRFLPDDRI
jgi:hypothetical protein